MAALEYGYGCGFLDFRDDYTFSHNLDNDIHTAFLRYVIAYEFVAYSLPSLQILI